VEMDTTETDCSSLFEEAYDFGSGATCQFTSSQILEIRLGENSNITYGRILHFQPNAFKVASVPGVMCNPYINGNSIVTLPERQAPVAVLNTPTLLLTQCQNLTVSTCGTTGYGTLRYKWTTDPEDLPLI